MTRIERSLWRVGFCRPSSITRTSIPDSVAAWAAAARSAPIQVGAVCASRSGSSPTSRNVWRCFSTNVGTLILPPYPRLKKPAALPEDLSLSITDSATGVFPAPPATTFPIQMTGTLTWNGTTFPIRELVFQDQNRLIGDRIAGTIPSLRQKSGARIGWHANRLGGRDAVQMWIDMEKNCVQDALFTVGNRSCRGNPPLPQRRVGEQNADLLCYFFCGFRDRRRSSGGKLPFNCEKVIHVRTMHDGTA